MKISTLKRLCELGNLITSFRANNGGVRLSRLKDFKTIVLVITNGHYLVEEKFEDVESWVRLDTPILFNRPNCIMLKSFLRKLPSNISEVPFELETYETRPNDYKLILNESFGMFVEKALNYPRYEHILPQKDKMLEKGAVQVAFNPKYLEKLWKACKQGKSSSMVTLTIIPDNGTGIHVSIPNTVNNTTILMPMKV